MEFERLIINTLPHPRKILKVLSKDLKSTNTAILKKFLKPINLLTNETDKLTELAMICRDKSYAHPQWSKLAGRVRMIYIKRLAPQTFTDSIRMMKPVLMPSFYNFCVKHSKRLEKIIDPSLDWNFDIFGVETMLNSYLTRVKDEEGISHLAETPQYKNLRIAAFMWYTDFASDDCFKRIEQTYNYIARGYISPASPTQFNAGMKRPQMASCFLLSVDDSLNSLKKAWGDESVISKNNGGIGKVLDAIRHSEIGNHGWSKGQIPWIKIDNEILSTIDQGGKRKGSACEYTCDWHIDIFEFVDLKKPTGKDELRARDLFYGIMISDLFMQRINDDKEWTLFCPAKTDKLYEKWGNDFERDYLSLEKKYDQGLIHSGARRVKARDLWKHILLSQIATGMPFILYKDAINRKSNQQNLGTIRTSNLCVHGDTYILTDQGQIPIKHLVDNTIKVWNGKEWSKTTIRKTGENKNLIKILFSDGTKLECTPEHKFYVNLNDKIIEKEAQTLKIDDKLISFNLPIVEFADIRYKGEYIEGTTIQQRIEYFKQWRDEVSAMILETEEGEESCLMGIFENETTAKDFQLMLQTLGVYSSITLPFDEYGIWRIDIDWCELTKNNCIKIPHKTGKCPYGIYVEKIENGSQNVDTFCFTEPLRHMGMFNGILTGQCTEIVEYVDNENIASCNLTSIPVSKFVKLDEDSNRYFDFEQLGQVTRHVVRVLGQVIDRTYYPPEVPEIKHSNSLNRPLGIGIQDLAGCLAKMDLCWDSPEAKILNERIAKVMYYHAMDENVKMAEEYGYYENFPGSPASQGLFQFDLWELEKIEKDLKSRGISIPFVTLKNSYKFNIIDNEFDFDELRQRMIKYGLYFSLLFAQMPTASSAHMLGNNESRECYTQLLYTRTVLSGQFVICVEHLVNDLEKINMWNTNVLHYLFQNQGSIQGFPIDNVPEEYQERFIYIQNKFKTAFEHPQKLFADLYLDMAKYQCQTSSNNVFMKEPTLTKLNAYHFYMWQGGAKTGMYYLKQIPRSEPLNFSLDVIKISDEKPVKKRIRKQKRKRDEETDSRKKIKIVGPELYPREREELIFKQTYMSLQNDDDKNKESENFDNFVCNLEEGCMMCSS